MATGDDAAEDELKRAMAARVRRRRIPLIVLLVLGGLLVLIGLLILAMWVVPEWLNRRDFATPAERATAVNAARVPVAAIFAAAVAGLGVWVSHRGVVTARETLAQTRRRDDDTTRLTQAGQYTDRYIKAIGLINDDKLNARLGGLYALEQLAKEAPLTYHATIVDVLSAFIRERAPWPPPAPTQGQDAPPQRSQRRVAAEHREPAAAQQDPPSRPTLDVQTALTILGRRDPTPITPDGQHHQLEDHPLDLSGANLQGADLRGANLEGAVLARTRLAHAELFTARLARAVLYEADLQRAVLIGAYLQDANLVGAHLQRADLLEAHLQDASLYGASLEGAVLRGAHLQDAHLYGASLEGAVLRAANLEGAVLRGANLQGADLRGANLQGAVLREASLEGADLSGAHLVDGGLSREQLAVTVFAHGPQRPDD